MNATSTDAYAVWIVEFGTPGRMLFCVCESEDEAERMRDRLANYGHWANVWELTEPMT